MRRRRLKPIRPVRQIPKTDAKTVQNLGPLPQKDVDQLAKGLCASDVKQVESTYDLMTRPLPNGYDMQAIGTWQAGRIAKACCKDWTHAFYYLEIVVTSEHGRSAAYEIPQYASRASFVSTPTDIGTPVFPLEKRTHVSSSRACTT